LKPYSLSSDAQQDLENIRAYYLKHADARVARYVINEITAGFRFLAATPGAGHARPDLTAEAVKFWQVFSYLIVFDATMQPLGIARVVHSSRNLKALFNKKPPRG
jgi:plasmid stabilization system protein ParE